MRYLIILAILLLVGIFSAESCDPSPGMNPDLPKVNNKYDIVGEARFRIHRVNEEDDEDTELSRRHHRHAEWRRKALAASSDRHTRRNDEEVDPVTYHYAFLDKDEPRHKTRRSKLEYDDPRDMPVHLADVDQHGDDLVGDVDKRSTKSRLKSVFEKGRDRRQVTEADCTGNNERFESCFSGCAAVTCDNPRDRLRPCYPFCEPGCVCAEPFVRDERTHKCVLPQDCTMSMKGIPDIEGE